MKKYATKPRKILLAFLESHPDEHYSIDDIAEQLQGEEVISTSSIYRNINDMVKEGIVARSCADGTRQFLYQFIGGEVCSTHIHLKCDQCGKLFHVEQGAMDEVMSSIRSSNGFTIDVKRAVLHGVCESCD